jgi:hypothetical protein
MKKELGCIFLKDGLCNSDYGKGITCDGINVPKNCPYGSFGGTRR